MLTKRASLLGLFALAVCAPLGVAQSIPRIDVLAYGSPLDYRGSRIKSEGWTTGAYVFLGDGKRHGTETGVARTHINYVDSTALDQTDLSLAYNYFGSRVRWRLGAHFVNSDDVLTDGSRTLFAGLALYRASTWSLGANVYRSSYPDYLTPMSVWQVEPVVSWTFNDIALLRYLFVEFSGRYIRLTDEVGLGEKDLFSAGMRSAFSQSGWTLTLSVWSGEQAFAARESGFMVFNLAEKHTGGFGLSVRRLLGEHVALSVGFHNEQFRDIGFTEDVSLNVLQIALGVSL